MSALGVRLGVVGDLVAVEPGASNAIEGVVVHIDFEFVGGFFEVAAEEARGHGGVGFVGEGVGAEVVEVEGEGTLEIVGPFGEGLSRDGVDEIEGETRDVVGAGDGDGALDGVGVVVSFEGFEVGRVEGLRAHRDPVDLGTLEDFTDGFGEGLGVGLDGPFGVVGECEDGFDCGEELREEVGREEGGGSASDEDGVEGGVVREGGDGLEFGDGSVGECFLSVLSVHDGVEVAVVAFVDAEGDVDIEGYRSFGIARGDRGAQWSSG